MGLDSLAYGERDDVRVDLFHGVSPLGIGNPEVRRSYFRARSREARRIYTELATTSPGEFADCQIMSQLIQVICCLGGAYVDLPR
jgi:hypothetical protein